MTDISGTISADEAWGDDTYPTPIRLTGNVVLAAGIAVNALPGVRITAAGAVSISGEGELHATGEPGRPVVFTSDRQHRNGWIGIVKTADTGLHLFLEHCEIRNASAGVQLIGSYGNLRDVKFWNCEVGVDMQQAGPELSIMDKLTFEHCRTGLKLEDDVLATAGQFVSHCTFKRNDIGVYLERDADLAGKGHRFWGNSTAAIFAAAPAAPVALDLTGCWFGSDSGPYHATLNPTGTGDTLIIDSDYTATVSPWTQLQRYIPIMDDLRDYMSRLFALSQGDGPQPLDLITDEVLESIIDRKEDQLDSWYLGGRVRDKRLFARSAETTEAHDMMSRMRMVRTDYWPVLTISAVQRRTGQAAYSAVSENEYSGWYSSAKMKEIGQVMLMAPSPYEKDAMTISYEHGYYDAPDVIRDAIIKMAALDLYQSILQIGTDGEDVFASRARQLRADIEGIRAQAATTKSKSWTVV